MEIHFISVGLGTMTLILMPDGTSILYDCNITQENAGLILKYLRRVIGNSAALDIFINSHRDADHMRGIKTLHASHPIKAIWDSGVPGTTTNSPEYREYMDLRRSIKMKGIEARKYWTYGNAKLRCLNSKWQDYSDPNQQSIVVKIEYGTESVMLAGDTDYRPWKEKILIFYSKSSHLE